VFGGYEIQGWLANSVNRTTIFAQLLYADLAIWLIIALDAALAPDRTGQANPIPAAADVLAATPALSPPSSSRTPTAQPDRQGIRLQGIRRQDR
jgi:hypothetical protein